MASSTQKPNMIHNTITSPGVYNNPNNNPDDNPDNPNNNPNNNPINPNNPPSQVKSRDSLLSSSSASSLAGGIGELLNIEQPSSSNHGGIGESKSIESSKEREHKIFKKMKKHSKKKKHKDKKTTKGSVHPSGDNTNSLIEQIDQQVFNDPVSSEHRQQSSQSSTQGFQHTIENSSTNSSKKNPRSISHKNASQSEGSESDSDSSDSSSSDSSAGSEDQGDQGGEKESEKDRRAHKGVSPSRERAGLPLHSTDLNSQQVSCIYI